MSNGLTPEDFDSYDAMAFLSEEKIVVSRVLTPDGYAAAYHREDGLLTCAGCACSAARMPWPCRPSGEGPCGNCVRNTEYSNGEPRKDNYMTIDTRMELINLYGQVARARVA